MMMSDFFYLFNAFIKLSGEDSFHHGRITDVYDSETESESESSLLVGCVSARHTGFCRRSHMERLMGAPWRWHHASSTS